MSALPLEVQPTLAGPAVAKPRPRRFLMVAAALAGALAPWALLVISLRGPAGSAASCFGGPMPIYRPLPAVVPQPIFSAARKASCGISTWPTWRMRFLPSFCFSRSLRLREMSPP